MKRTHRTVGDIAWWLLLSLATALAVLFGQALQAAEEPATPPALLDAQRQAAEQARWQRAARAQCREAYGDSARVLETREGHLVCRRAGPLT